MSGVLVCPERLAAAVGEQILRAGGNAIDAAVAAAFAQGVVNPMMCGLGGTAEVNLYLAASRENLLIEGIGGAGSLARPDIFEFVGETIRAGRWAVTDYANYIGHKASTIPTFLRVVGEAHRLFGRLPWDQVVEPAAILAADGFPVSERLARGWDPHTEGKFDWPSGMQTLTASAAAARIYLRDGRFLKAGEIQVCTDYARSLRRIAEHGPSIFYEGAMGQEIADDFAANGGLFTRDDLRRVRATLSRPLVGSYRGYTLHGSGPYRLEMYHILEGMALRQMGLNSPRYLDMLARAFQAAHIDRARYAADHRCEDVPTNMLISKRHAAELRYLIESSEDIRYVEPGTQPYFGTTALVAMDDEGNTVSMKHSNGNSSGVVTPGLGFLYNNHMHNFDPRPGYRNSVAPGKTPVGAAGGPLIVCRDGEPVAAVAHPGRAGSTSEVQVVLNMLEIGMSPQEAVSAPRIHADYPQRTVFVDPDFPEGLLRGLQALGTQQVNVTPILSPLSAVRRDPATGEIQGGSDPRGEGGLAIVP